MTLSYTITDNKKSVSVIIEPLTPGSTSAISIRGTIPENAGFNMKINDIELFLVDKGVGRKFSSGGITVSGCLCH